MMNPRILIDAIVTQLQSIPDLVTAMGGDQSNIYAHHFYSGQDHRLAEALGKMTEPSVLVVWERLIGGQFSQNIAWKFAISIYVRPANAANQTNPVSSEDLVWIVLNAPVLGQISYCNIRNVRILPNTEAMDLPIVTHLVDELGYDYFKIDCLVPEIGDSLYPV